MENEVEYIPYSFINNNKKNMNWKSILSAVVIAIIVAVLTYILKVGNIWAVSYHQLINNAVMAGIAAFLAQIGTTQQGRFLGVLPVK